MERPPHGYVTVRPVRLGTHRVSCAPCSPSRPDEKKLLSARVNGSPPPSPSLSPSILPSTDPPILDFSMGPV